MMLVKTKEGITLNLAHAFEWSYSAEKEELIVWWAFPTCDEVYADRRLVRHRVTAAEWGAR